MTWPSFEYLILLGLVVVPPILADDDSVWWDWIYKPYYVLRVAFHIWYLGQCYTGESPQETANQIILDICSFYTISLVIKMWDWFLDCFDKWVLNPVWRRKQKPAWIEFVSLMMAVAAWFGALLSVHQATMQTIPNFEYLILLALAHPWEIHVVIYCAQAPEEKEETEEDRMAFISQLSPRSQRRRINIMRRRKPPGRFGPRVLVWSCIFAILVMLGRIALQILYIIYCYSGPKLVSAQDSANQIALDISAFYNLWIPIVAAAAVMWCLSYLGTARWDDEEELYVKPSAPAWVRIVVDILIIAVFLGAWMTVHYPDYRRVLAGLTFLVIFLLWRWSSSVDEAVRSSLDNLEEFLEDLVEKLQAEQE